MTTSPDDHAAPPKSGIPLPPLRACLAGLGLNSCSSLTVTPVFELRRVAVRMHRSTIINQLKSCEGRLKAVIFIGGRLRKRKSAKKALRLGGLGTGSWYTPSGRMGWVRGGSRRTRG